MHEASIYRNYKKVKDTFYKYGVKDLNKVKVIFNKPEEFISLNTIFFCEFDLIDKRTGAIDNLVGGTTFASVDISLTNALKAIDPSPKNVIIHEINGTDQSTLEKATFLHEALIYDAVYSANLVGLQQMKENEVDIKRWAPKDALHLILKELAILKKAFYEPVRETQKQEHAALLQKELKSYTDVFYFLIECGLDITAKNEAGKTPAEVLVETLPQLDSNKSPAALIADKEYLSKVIHTLLEKGATVHSDLLSEKGYIYSVETVEKLVKRVNQPALCTNLEKPAQASPSWTERVSSPSHSPALKRKRISEPEDTEKVAHIIKEIQSLSPEGKELIWEFLQSKPAISAK